MPREARRGGGFARREFQQMRRAGFFSDSDHFQSRTSGLPCGLPPDLPGMQPCGPSPQRV